MKQELIDFLNWLQKETGYKLKSGVEIVDIYLSINDNAPTESRSINENEGKKKKYHRSKCTIPGGNCIWDRKCNSCGHFR